MSIQKLVKEVHQDPRKAGHILKTYGRIALKAQEKTNCVTEILLDSAEKWVTDASIKLKGLLASNPVISKDTVDITGYDSTVGYSRYVGMTQRCWHCPLPCTLLRHSAMARTFNDLTYFTRSIVQMKPWKYDYSIHPIPWRSEVSREAYKRRWFEVWEERGFDHIVAPPNTTPAVSRHGMHDACSSCGYPFPFDLLDYTAGVIPVTHVDKKKDQLPKGFHARSLNGVARGAYKHYNADDMRALPVGV